MKIMKNVPLFLACILSSIANLLYIVKIAPEWVFRLGFVIVMIGIIIMNLRSIINNKKAITSSVAPVNQSEVKPKSSYSQLIIFVLVFWILSYGVALFTS